MENFLKMLALAGKGGSGSGAPSDWNASEGEPGHVLNRTHYEEVGLVELPIECEWDDSNDFYMLMKPLNLEIGKTYIVNWNGTEYACVATEAESMGIPAVTIGNLGNAGVGAEDNGMPFLVSEVPAEVAAAIGFYAIAQPLDSTQVTFSIYAKSEVIKTLDPKYLPDGVPYIESGMVEIVPECSIRASASEPAMFGTAYVPEVGKTYTVNWNGTEYTCVAQSASGFPYIGDASSILGTEPTGEPFLIASEGVLLAFAFDGSEEQTVSVMANDFIIRQLDEKCLPDYLQSASAEIEILPKTSATVDFVNNSEVYVPFNNRLVAGETYTVKWHDNEYTCEAQKFSAFVAIGNFKRVGGQDTGEPFFMYQTFEGELCVYPLDEIAEITFSISKSVRTINTKYLPDSLASYTIDLDRETWEEQGVGMYVSSLSYDAFIDILYKGGTVIVKKGYACFRPISWSWSTMGEMGVLLVCISDTAGQVHSKAGHPNIMFQGTKMPPA